MSHNLNPLAARVVVAVPRELEPPERRVDAHVLNSAGLAIESTAMVPYRAHRARDPQDNLACFSNSVLKLSSGMFIR